MKAALPPGPYWQLKTLGVSPRAQGRGAGGALIRHGLQTLVEPSGLPCVLDTAKPANVAYYERFGFEVVTEARIGDPGGLPMWLMRRA